MSAQADQASLRQAFRRQSKTLHPDTTALPAEQAALHFQLRLKESYELLADPVRRRLYDEHCGCACNHRSHAPLRTETVDGWDGIGERRPSRGVNGFRCCCWSWPCWSASCSDLVWRPCRGETGKCHPGLVVRCLSHVEPPSSTPLNQHSLRALEDWLNSLNA